MVRRYWTDTWILYISSILNIDGYKRSSVGLFVTMSNSTGFIHQTCLQEWLGSTNKKVCELCRYEFKLHATLRPLNKVSVKWLRFNFSTDLWSDLYNYKCTTCCSASLLVLCNFDCSLDQLTCSFYTILDSTTLNVKLKNSTIIVHTTIPAKTSLKVLKVDSYKLTIISNN